MENLFTLQPKWSRRGKCFTRICRRKELNLRSISLATSTWSKIGWPLLDLLKVTCMPEPCLCALSIIWLFSVLLFLCFVHLSFQPLFILYSYRPSFIMKIESPRCVKPMGLIGKHFSLCPNVNGFLHSKSSHLVLKDSFYDGKFETLDSPLFLPSFRVSPFSGTREKNKFSPLRVGIQAMPSYKQRGQNQQRENEGNTDWGRKRIWVTRLPQWVFMLKRWEGLTALASGRIDHRHQRPSWKREGQNREKISVDKKISVRDLIKH